MTTHPALSKIERAVASLLKKRLKVPVYMRLPTLSDGKRRYATPAQYARLSAMAKAAGKPLADFMELGGHLEKGKMKL